MIISKDMILDSINISVKIRQFSSITEAKAAEKRAIKLKQPKYNIRYK